MEAYQTREFLLANLTFACATKKLTAKQTPIPQEKARDLAALWRLGWAV